MALAWIPRRSHSARSAAPASAAKLLKATALFLLFWPVGVAFALTDDMQAETLGQAIQRFLLRAMFVALYYWFYIFELGALWVPELS